MPNIPKIGELRDLVWVCTTVEKPDDWVSSIVERPGVFRCHARIRQLRPFEIFNFQAVFKTERIPTVEITIRNPPDVKVDLNHWVYRDRPPTKIWYKVRSVEELGDVAQWLGLKCSLDTILDQRSDVATQELPPTWDDPEAAPISSIIDRI